MHNRTRRGDLIDVLDVAPFPHPWLAGSRPDRQAFARLVVHAHRPASWRRWALDAYALRWGPDELVVALRFAGHLAPLPGWAAALLRQHVTSAA